jgi:hypothetical protein
VHLRGAHVPFGKVVKDSVSEVPVDRIDGTAFVSFDDADSYLSNHRFAGQLITLEPGSHGTATVNDRTSLAGRQLTLHGVGAVSVSHNIISVRVSKLAGSAVGAGTRRLLTKELHITLPLQGLPFQIQLKSVSVTQTGVSATGGARHVVLGSR